jgi:hypothetical protein
MHNHRELRKGRPKGVSYPASVGISRTRAPGYIPFFATVEISTTYQSPRGKYAPYFATAIHAILAKVANSHRLCGRGCECGVVLGVLIWATSPRCTAAVFGGMLIAGCDFGRLLWTRVGGRCSELRSAAANPDFPRARAADSRKELRNQRRCTFALRFFRSQTIGESDPVPQSAGIYQAKTQEGRAEFLSYRRLEQLAARIPIRNLF